MQIQRQTGFGSHHGKPLQMRGIKHIQIKYGRKGSATYVILGILLLILSIYGHVAARQRKFALGNIISLLAKYTGARMRTWGFVVKMLNN